MICNLGALEKGELKEPTTGEPSLYVGETSRSIQERALEHWGAARWKEEKSHMAKHQAMVHGGEDPEFVFKIVSHHRTALNRQVREAVRIGRRGGAGRILNSKAEFNRCHIPRLIIEEEDEESRKSRIEKEQLYKEETQKVLDNMDLSWEEKMSRQRDLVDRKRRRQDDPVEDDPQIQVARKRVKKTKYAVLGEDWGLEDGDEDAEEDIIECDERIDVPCPPPYHSKKTKNSINCRLFPTSTKNTSGDG